MVLLVYEGGDAVLEANSDASLVPLSGEPIDEPIVGHGPFVMNTIEKINEAIVDFNSGLSGRIPH